jgi:hypothetical protein
MNLSSVQCSVLFFSFSPFGVFKPRKKKKKEILKKEKEENNKTKKQTMNKKSIKRNQYTTNITEMKKEQTDLVAVGNNV